MAIIKTQLNIDLSRVADRGLARLPARQPLEMTTQEGATSSLIKRSIFRFYEMILKKLTTGEIKGFKVLGQATAASLPLAVYLGSKYKANFAEIVVGYTCEKSAISNLFNKELGKQEYMQYTFYEKED